jgi:adenylate kinase
MTARVLFTELTGLIWPAVVSAADASLNIVLLGAPGSGKGTQAARLSSHYGVAAISTGEILRTAVLSGTPLGQQVKGTMEAGGLVDDDTMVELVRQRLTQPDTARGFVLDGFPRSLSQARTLDEFLHGRPVHAMVLMVPIEKLERRLDSRRMCLKCRTIHAGGTRYGSEAEVCSRCGLALIKRDDDNLETIRHRLATYRDTVEPLLRYYADRSVLGTIDGTEAPDLVARALIRHIERAR